MCMYRTTARISKNCYFVKRHRSIENLIHIFILISSSSIKCLHSRTIIFLFPSALSPRSYVVNSEVRRSSVEKSGSKMNHCSLQQNAFMSREDSKGLVSMCCDPVDSVVCPRPRRLGVLANNVTRPHILHYSQSEAADVCDFKAGEDLLDILRRKEESVSFVASSSPFFLGSPPSRAANPLAQDARFGDEKVNPLSPSLSPFLLSASRVKGGGGGCGRINFGVKPATVRVEGFDCLNRDRQNSSIPTMA